MGLTHCHYYLVGVPTVQQLLLLRTRELYCRIACLLARWPVDGVQRSMEGLSLDCHMIVGLIEIAEPVTTFEYRTIVDRVERVAFLTGNVSLNYLTHYRRFRAISVWRLP